MWICIVCLLGTMTITYFINQKNEKNANKERAWMGKLLLLMQILGLFLCIYTRYKDRWSFQGVLEKNAAGEGSYTEEFYVKTDDFDGQISIDIPEVALTEEEENQALKQAVDEIETSILGNNESQECVCSDLKIKSKYADGLVVAKWEFSNYDVIDLEGHVLQENIEKEELVTARAVLTCEEKSIVYEYPLRLVPETIRDIDSLSRKVKKYVEGQSGEETQLRLPDEMDGISLKWKKKIQWQGEWICILGLAANILMLLQEDVEKKKQEKSRQENLKKDYPFIVGKLGMYMAAGVSLSEAVARIAKDYVRRQKPMKEKEGYEYILRMHYELEQGIGEKAAIEHLGNQNIKEYKKLSLLLLQNQKHGGDDFINRLEQEEVEAFDERKRLARIQGEELSTKLLIPLMGMLALVIVLIILPAFMQLQGI